MPISLLAIVLNMDRNDKYHDVKQFCHVRNECLSYCTSDNFPELNCVFQDVKLTYNGNEYDKFYTYQNPKLTHADYLDNSEIESLESNYNYCIKTLDMNPTYPFSEIQSDRQWRVHSCFEICKDPNNVDPAFSVDERPVCDDRDNKLENGILCLQPHANECETYVHRNHKCFDSQGKICLDWQTILLSILISNFIQVVFEASLAFSFELTLVPTLLDRMQDPENFDEDIEQSASNPDQKTEPNCGVVIQKCWSELLSIMLYVVMLVTLTTGLIHHIKGGKIYTSLINFGIALFIDQVKSLPVQFVIYWIVIRRCNKFDTPNFEVWDDDVILQGGVELSLFQWMRL